MLIKKNNLSHFLNQHNYSFKLCSAISQYSIISRFDRFDFFIKNNFWTAYSFRNIFI